jgi:cellulose synthase/poly-beta-1,6-N-acetylglucosamine synthase-like glycosyltransferase
VPEHSSSRPLVSVVAPVYNEVAALPELVDRLGRVASALDAEYRLEFILIDDGSNDGSLDVARKLRSNDARLRVVELRRNYGQTAALQAGPEPGCRRSVEPGSRQPRRVPEAPRASRRSAGTEAPSLRSRCSTESTLRVPTACLVAGTGTVAFRRS